MTRRRPPPAGAPVLAAAAAAALALAAPPHRAAAAAQEPPAPGAPASPSALAALLDQANFWRLQNRPDMALRALERALVADPDHLDALAGAAAAQAQLGDRAGAETRLARLRKLAPADPRAARVAETLRVASVDPAGLAEARRLAREGQTAAAVARYNGVFGAAGGVPDAHAIEYHTTLAGTEAGWDEARAALERFAAKHSHDSRAKLALAQALTYRGHTRAEGIKRLRAIAEGGTGADAASAAAAWRQAALWLGHSPAAAAELEALLRRAPNDPVLAQRLEEARDPRRQAAADIGGEARLRGFERLNAGRLGDATGDFEAALARDANDADALGGLGVVRLRQGRLAEARQLLERAVAAAPGRGAQWRPALEGAAYGLELTEARGALKRQDRDAAEALLRRAVERDVPDRADAEAMLGELAMRRGDHEGAEARFRAALARRPDLAAAALGLRDALRRQNRAAEAAAVALPAGARAAAAAADPSAGAADPAERRVAALREEAARAADPAAAAGLLRAALAEAPRNPWVRLDLARALLRQGRGAEARALMGEQFSASGAGRPGADGAHAAALFAEEDGRAADAAAFLERVEPRLRSPDMARLLGRARALAEVRGAAALAEAGGQAEARGRLVAIAARRNGDGAGAAAAVRALAAMGDKAGAADAARAALAAGRDAPPAARLALASAMLEAGLDGEAAALSREVSEAPAASAEDRRQALAVQSGLAVRAADRLNEQGDRAAAYDRLLPVLARDPQDPGANLALARLHQGHRQPEQARAIAEAVLARDPRNLEARLAAAELAAQARDRRRAETLLAEARALRPSDARVSLSEARIARAAGDERRALRALETAAEQRRAQIGGEPAAFATVAGPRAFPNGANPFRAAATAGALPGLPQDRIAAEIARELAVAREATAAQAQLAAGGRVRSGTAGLDKLQEFSATAEVSAAVAGGRLAARATPVALSNGDLPSDPVLRRRFGTNALAGPGAAAAPPRDGGTATGVAVGLAYTSRGGGFSADVGTTPLGFRNTDAVGGVQVAPLLTDNLRLRLTAERRAITDSLLSWAGARDGRTGQFWGGVTRTGGHGQLEYTAGPATFYAGGGWSTIEGDGVAGNTRTGFGAGASYAVFRRPEEELTVGADLVYFAYDKNLRHFTLGHGGYFSPQSYAALNLPVDYRARSEDLSWRLGATVGFANWREEDAPFFPRDGALQRSLEAAAAGDPTLQARYSGRSETGLVGGLRGDVEYAVTPAFRIGALLRYDRAANWHEARGLLSARYRFGP